MQRPFLLALALVLASAPALAQDSQPGAGRCSIADTIVVRGNTRISDGTIRNEAALPTGAPLSFNAVQRALRGVYALNQFDDVQLLCSVAAGRTTLTLVVVERPLLGEVKVTGVSALPERTVSEKVDMLIGRPIDPAQVARSITRIDSVYESQGYYLAQVRAETTLVEGKTTVTFRVEEGRRLAVSGVRVSGNSRLAAGDIVGAMKTRPEGFWWFRRGEFDEDKYAADLAEHIPALYAKQGYVDFEIVRDTLIVDRERGKALIELEVREGPQYRIGSFEVSGNRRFNSEEIARFYPFGDTDPTLTQRVVGLVRRREAAGNVFDQARWEEATNNVRTAYSNEGYIRASVRPVVDRAVAADSSSVVNLRWEIEEELPAIINRIEIAGNDYTTEACIRNQLVILPGDVFNQDRLVRSWYNIANLNFFETPLPQPDIRPAGERDVDVVFQVKEKRTGSVQFGASMGQGTGLGGFIGLEQPNLFGQCKRGQLNWQFGRYVNDFSLSYTDPAIEQSQISGTVSAYRTQSRFRIANLGRSTRVGGSLQFGFPVPKSPFTRLFVSYGGEQVKYGDNGLLGESASACESGNCFRSTLGFTTTHDTRIDLPFATGGGMQTVTAQFNGGPLGGTAKFQRYTTELRSYAPIGQLGGTKPGSQPIKFVLGLSARAGAVFGNTGPFFYSQQFALGGTQFGEQLRGYEEFSITPGQGYLGGTNSYSARRESFGSAFFTTTAELGMRVNQNLYMNLFYDAGNIWNRPRDFNPTRLLRGTGLGLATITPLGPLGIDFGYGLDRTKPDPTNPARQVPDPRWQIHFKLGQLF